MLTHCGCSEYISLTDRCCRACFFFFFFQAEDGIRDLTVTGVQTCALPICRRRRRRRERADGRWLVGLVGGARRLVARLVVPGARAARLHLSRGLPRRERRDRKSVV